MLVERVQNVLALKGQVGLEAQDNGRIFEAFEFTDRRYVVEHTAMGGSHILGAKRLGSQHLRDTEWSVGVWGCVRFCWALR